jgi:hypothetical protein
MDEDSEKRAIEDLHVVSSVRFHAGDKTHKSGVCPTSGVAVVRSWWGPSASRTNVPLLVTAYVNYLTQRKSGAHAA